MRDLLHAATLFAKAAHDSIGQTRKFTDGQPYWIHPLEVAEIVAGVTDDAELQAAALLHDTLEDVPWVTAELLAALFGERVAALVVEVTNVSSDADGDREVRQALERAHMAGASPDAKTIKLADVLSNVSKLAERSPEFALSYLPEKAALLQALEGGDPTLRARCMAVVAAGLSAVGLQG